MRFEGYGFICLQVAVDIDYHHNMLASHLKVNPKEAIVGWYFSFPTLILLIILIISLSHDSCSCFFDVLHCW